MVERKSQEEEDSPQEELSPQEDIEQVIKEDLEKDRLVRKDLEVKDSPKEEDSKNVTIRDLEVECEDGYTEVNER